MLSAFRKWIQALLKEEHELAEADSRFLSVDGLRVHYKAAPAPNPTPGTGSIRSPQRFSPGATFQMVHQLREHMAARAPCSCARHSVPTLKAVNTGAMCTTLV